MTAAVAAAALPQNTSTPSRNPIIHADVRDMPMIRVGSSYYFAPARSLDAVAHSIITVK